MPRETSAAIGELFHGYSGYVQADAKSVYDLLFKPAAERPPLDDGEPDLDERHEVGCWSHCRRKAWEVAITSKDPVAREAVLRIKQIFDLDRSWRGKPPDEIRSLRQPKVPGTLLGPSARLHRIQMENWFQAPLADWAGPQG